MPLGENRDTNHRGVYNLEFVVRIVAFGFFPQQFIVSAGAPYSGAVGPTEAAVPRDLFLPHSATSYLSLVFLPLVPKIFRPLATV